MQKGGYDRNTVGEDMELVLRIQDRVRAEPHCRIVYAFDSVAVTKPPNTFNTLFYQRERWQRGLLDSLIKHRKMILNPRFGLLGMFVLPYQIIIELLGPVYAVIYIFLSSFMGTLSSIFNPLCMLVSLSYDIYLHSRIFGNRIVVVSVTKSA